MNLPNSLKIVWAKYPELSEAFIDIEVEDTCGNRFEGLLRLKKDANCTKDDGGNE